MPSTSSCLTLFQKIHGREARLLARAPGRVNLIGEHVDYQDGWVLPVAIDRYIEMAAAPMDRPEVVLSSAAMGGEPVRVPLNRLEPLEGSESWANYVIGVVAGYVEEGVTPVGFEAVIVGDLPAGAGLSSSAALESATAVIVEKLTQTEKTPGERAALCRTAEHRFAGVPCGLMDQLIVNAGARGQALLIDCETAETTPVPLPPGVSLIIANSGVCHALADGEYAKRKADCESAAGILGVSTLRQASRTQVEEAQSVLGDRLFRRARHVVGENERVEVFARALRSGEVGGLGGPMAESHRSLCDDYEVSCGELDSLVDLAGTHGAIGSRMTGGGFGGSTINLVPDTHGDVFCRNVAEDFARSSGTEIEVFEVAAVDGVSVKRV
ncbi:MAG: galactokinase [Verrucomicrobiota bacterium]